MIRPFAAAQPRRVAIALAALLAIPGMAVGASVVQGRPAAGTQRHVPVPEALQGRWARVWPSETESCTPAHDDLAKGTIHASATELRVWEARRRPTRVVRSSSQRYVIDLDLDYSDDPAVTHRRTTFTLSNSGRALRAQTPADPEAELRDLQYVRCPSSNASPA